ncbi:MAG: choice-of-anchor J domain-containing protein [Bacteroidota bacterium]
MKQSIILLIFLVFSISIEAQIKRPSDSKLEIVDFKNNKPQCNTNNLRTTSIFTENFQNGMPSNFTLINNDGSTPNDSIFGNKAWIIMENEQLLGDSVAASTSWYTSGVKIADDWMITPAITIIEGCALSWNAMAIQAEYPDGYEVKISTTGLQITDFTTNLISVAQEFPNWTKRTVDLSAYQGQTVYIAFRNNSNDMNMLFIDDIEVYQKNPFDVTINKIDYSPYNEYPIIPIKIARPIYFKTDIINSGIDAVSTVSFDLSVPKENFTANRSVSSGLGAVDTLYSITQTNPLIVDITDTLKAFYNVSISENENNLTDNIDSLSLVVSDSVMARDLDNFQSYLGFKNFTGFLGQVFELKTADTLTSVSFNLRLPTMGDSCKVQIWHIGATDTTLVASSFNYIIPSSNSNWYSVGIDGNYFVLEANEKYIIGVRQSSVNSLTLGATKDFFNPNTTVYRVDNSDWRTVEYSNFLVSFGVRLNFGAVKPLPPIDVAIKSVYGPFSSCNMGSETISALIKNYGATPINNFPIKMNVDGTIISETVSATINSLGTYMFTFSTLADLSTDGLHTIIVYSNVANDADLKNDTAEFYVTKMLPKNIPYTMGFESTESLDGWSVIDANNDGSTWTVDTLVNSGYQSSGYAQYSYSQINAANDMLLTTCINFESAKTYTLSFACKAQGATYKEKMKVYLMNSQNINDTVFKIIDLNQISNTVYLIKTKQFNVPTDGSYYIGFKAYSDSNKYYIRLDEISITETTGINEKTIPFISIYPNPAREQLNIDCNQTIIAISISNSIGQVVKDQSVNFPSAQVNTDSLNKGIYFVKVRTANSTSTQKIIIQ